MSRNKGSVNVIVILLMGALVATAIYWFRPQPKTRPSVESKPPLVSVVSVTPQTKTLQVRTQGTVEASRSIKLVAEVSGRVQSVNPLFTDGGEFNQGDILVTLDDRDYQYRLLEAEAQVAAAARELALEKGQARQAKREWRDLGSKEANALSLRQPQVNAAEAQLASAIAQRKAAELNVQRATISAPFAGRVSTSYVDEGQYVTSGTVVADIYDSLHAEIRLPLTNKQIALLDLPLATVFTEPQQRKVVLAANVAGQMREWIATLIRTEARVDETTRFYFAVADIAFPFDQARQPYPLVMGLFVDAVIEGATLDNMIAVPEKSLVKNQWVYIVDDENRIQQREVTVLNSEGDTLWVRGNLSAGEHLVVSDPRVLQVEMLVTKVVQEQ